MSQELYDAVVEMNPSSSMQEKYEFINTTDAKKVTAYINTSGNHNNVLIAAMCAYSSFLRTYFVTPDEMSQFDRIVTSVREKYVAASVIPHKQSKLSSTLWAVANNAPLPPF